MSHGSVDHASKNSKPSSLNLASIAYNHPIMPQTVQFFHHEDSTSFVLHLSCTFSFSTQKISSLPLNAKANTSIDFDASATASASYDDGHFD